MKNQSTVKLVGLLLFISLVCGCKDEKSEVLDKRPESLGKEPRIKLKLQFLPGKYELVLSSISDDKFQMGDQNETMQESEISWYEIIASEPSPSGQTTCEITTKRIKSTDESSDTFDTDNPDSMKDDEIALIMLKHKIIHKYGPNGEFISSSGIDEMLDEYVQQQPSMAQFVSQRKESMEDAYGAEFLYGIASTTLPEDPVGVGAVWHKTISKSMPFVGLVKYDSENELIKIESIPAGKIAHIKHVGLIQGREGSKTSIGPVSMNMKNVHMKMTGDIQVNADTGLMIKQKMVTAGDMEMSMKDPRGKDISSKVRFNMTTEQTIKPIEQKQ
jgi:hypothetical protein